MILLVERLRIARMRFQLVHALAHLRKFFGSELDEDVPVEWRPGFSAVARAKRACRGNSHDDAAFAEALNRVHHHAASSRVPLLARGVIAQASDHFPIRAIIATAEEHARIGAEIDDAGFVFRARCDMPDAYERGIWSRF